MSESEESDAHKMGRDYAINGANTTNCSFSIFASPDATKDWERGRDEALAEKEVKTT